MDGFNFTPGGQAWTPVGLSTGYNFSEELYLSSNAAPGDITWPTANLAMYFPFYVQAPGNAQQIWWVNGSSVAGNIQSGIYDEYGNLLAQTGVIAQSGTSVPQAVTISVLLTPGRYYIALMCSSASAKLTGWTTGAAATNINRLLGIGEQTAANPLPNPAVFASSARSFIPLVGVSYSSLTM